MSNVCTGAVGVFEAAGVCCNEYMAMPIPFIEFHKQWFKMIEMVYKI
jgi:hypothetical protein